MRSPDQFWRPRIKLSIRRAIMKLAKKEGRTRDPSFVANRLLESALEVEAQKGAK